MPEVLFSPGGGCEARILKLIQRTRRHLRLAAYSLTSSNVCKALIQRSYAGVDLIVIVDKISLDVEYGRALSLIREHVSVYADFQHSIFHNKYLVTDQLTVQTGSYNYGVQAEVSNAENILILKDADVAKKYLKDFDRHLSHAVPLTVAKIRKFQERGVTE